MNPSKHAKELLAKQGKDNALKIVEYCEMISNNLLTAEDVPAMGDEVEVVEEMVKNKDGNLQTREKIRVDKKMQDTRLVKSARFWHQTADIVRKMTGNKKQNAQTQA